MELAHILGGIAAVLFILYLYHASWQGINQRAEAKYSFTPLTMGKGLFSMIPWIIILLGIYMGGDNTVLGFGAAAVLFLGLAIWIASKTSFSIAIGSGLLLVIAGAGLVVLIVLLSLLLAKKKEKKKS